MAVGNSYVVGRPIGSYSVLKPAGYSPEGYVLLGGKDGSREPILDGRIFAYDGFCDPSGRANA